MSKMCDLCCFSFSFFLFFLGLHLWHVKIPRLGVETELQLPAYSTAPAVQNLSHVCDLHHSFWQCWTLNSLSKARDQTHILMDTSRVLNPLSHKGNSKIADFNKTYLIIDKSIS